ncbi:MAG: hypothetical protein GX557_03760 [Chloroflexi bacterium]|nr:hypothetical protein [Chloroflexota bacterium]
MSTLSELRDTIEADLRDSGNTLWSTSELDQHIRHALRVYSQADPRCLSATVACTAGEREYALTSVSGALIEVLDVWYPWDSTAPAYPPPRPPWSLVGSAILLETARAPEAGEHLRVFYSAPHTLSGLDSATTTTLDASGEQAVALLAEAWAVYQYAATSINTVTVSGDTPRHLQEWAGARLALAQHELECIRLCRIRQQDARTAWAL